jgi:DNA-binding MarR family transcriptional regulator
MDYRGEEIMNVKKFDIGLAMLLEQTARSIYEKRAPTDIHPGQWSALRYFARAGRRARTVAGLAKYLGVTRGPASRATSALTKRGFLSSEENKDDRRSPLFTLTEKGRGVLRDDPIKRLALVISKMEESRKTVLIDSLNVLYAELSPSGDTESDGPPAPGDY